MLAAPPTPPPRVPGLEKSARSGSSQTKAWHWSLAAVARLLGSASKHKRKKSSAAGVTHDGMRARMSSDAIRSITALLSAASPCHGGCPVKSSSTVQPRLHTSARCQNCKEVSPLSTAGETTPRPPRFTTSGAIHAMVPCSPLPSDSTTGVGRLLTPFTETAVRGRSLTPSTCEKLTLATLLTELPPTPSSAASIEGLNLALPKSANRVVPSEARRRFAPFKSRCASPRRCKISIAPTTSDVYRRTRPSGRPLCLAPAVIPPARKLLGLPAAS